MLALLALSVTPDSLPDEPTPTLVTAGNAACDLLVVQGYEGGATLSTGGHEVSALGAAPHGGRVGFEYPSR